MPTGQYKRKKWMNKKMSVSLKKKWKLDPQMRENHRKGMIGHFVSDETKKKIGNKNRIPLGIKIKRFRKYNISGRHRLLTFQFGKPKICENRLKKIFVFNCNQRSKHFEWALKINRKYTVNKLDYFQLCRSCHVIYDIQSGIRKYFKNQHASS